MTIDVEEWFHILDVEGAHSRAEWPGLEMRVVANTRRVLDLLDEAGTRATCFVVGWVAARHPDLVRDICARGHEIGSHSYWHEILQRHDRASLRADLGRSKNLLEDLSGAPVRGFRAPGASMTPETAWAYDIIAELGFAYDSSLCPGYSSHGGYASPYLGPHKIRCAEGELMEIPSSTVGLAGRRIPYAGGGYLRLLPYAAIKAAIARENRQGRPTNIYIHPREIDPGQPRMTLPPFRRFKYYVGLGSMERKLRALLRDHHFVPAWEWLESHAQALEGRELDVREQVAALPPSPDPELIPPPPPMSPLEAPGRS